MLTTNYDEREKVGKSGFRQSYSTVDNIFSIFTLFQILKSKKKKLYCAFIDFEKAFDRVWRDSLFTNYYFTVKISCSVIVI
jgi:hypothetical protein